MRQRKFLISGLILFALAAQVLVIATVQGTRFWPWLDYKMYAAVHLPGEEMIDVDLFVLTPQGETPLHEDDFGLSFHTWRSQVVLPLARRQPVRFVDLKTPEALMAWLARHHPDLKVRGLRAVSHVHVLQREGLQPGPARSVLYEAPAIEAR